MFANKHAKILIALVCAVLGFMLATQFKTTERQKTINIQRAEDLSDRLKAVEKERDELSKEMEKLQAKAGDEVVAREIVRLKAFAGDFEMHGKGIKLVLDDSKIASKPGENPNLYIIHDDDLLRNRPLFKSFDQSTQKFFSVEQLPTSIFFTYHQRSFLIFFISSEPASTIRTFSTTPNRNAIIHSTGINNSTVTIRAKRALHNVTSFYSFIYISAFIIS
jgi:cell division protein FtsB